MATEVESKHEQFCELINRYANKMWVGVSQSIGTPSDAELIAMAHRRKESVEITKPWLLQFAIEVAKSERMRLAEQAEREALKSTVGHLAERQKMTSAELQADWPWISITADAWKEFAAWLRATAGEKGKGGQ